MGIFDKLIGKKKDEETKIVSDGCTIMVGDVTRKATRAFQEKGIRNIVNVWSSEYINKLTWPEGEVHNLTICLDHTIPVGVINVDKWYAQVLTAAGLDRWGNEPQIKIICTPAEKNGMILLHWDSVDQQKCFSTMDRLEKSVVEWS